MDSAINQTFEDKEIIVVNDGSTDNTLNILKQYESNNVKVIDQENQGVAVARNNALKEANGEYIQFLDSDDYLVNNALEKLYNCAKQYDVPLVRMASNVNIGPFKLGDFNYFGNINDSKLINLDNEKNYIVECISSVWDKFSSHDILENLNFPEGLKWEDLAVTPFLMARAKNIYHLKEELYNYNFMFNTTIYDTFHKCKKFTDLFKILDTLNKHFENEEISNKYKEQLEEITVLHILLRLNDVLSWRNINSSDKKAIIYYVVNILTIKCPNWQSNRILDVRKDLLFKKAVNTAKQYYPTDTNITIEESIKSIERILK